MSKKTSKPTKRISRPWIFLPLILAILVSGCSNQPEIPDSGEYKGAELSGQAAGFTLTDQTGASISLSDFDEKVVVLSFMDSQCKEVCPLTAVHLRDSNEMLEDQARSVAFIGINVNVEANRVADVLAATQKWRLDEIPSWHFLTGSSEALEPIWNAYGIGVVHEHEEADDILHTPGLFLIDQSGQKRWYISTPFDPAGTPQWTEPLSDLLAKRVRELLGES